MSSRRGLIVQLALFVAGMWYVVARGQISGLLATAAFACGCMATIPPLEKWNQGHGNLKSFLFPVALTVATSILFGNELLHQSRAGNDGFVITFLFGFYLPMVLEKPARTLMHRFKARRTQTR